MGDKCKCNANISELEAGFDHLYGCSTCLHSRVHDMMSICHEACGGGYRCIPLTDEENIIHALKELKNGKKNDDM